MTFIVHVIAASERPFVNVSYHSLDSYDFSQPEGDILLSSKRPHETEWEFLPSFSRAVAG